MDFKTLESQIVSYQASESDSGNSEYKLILTNASNEKIEKLKSQMRYRVEEGNGQAFYTLGVTDLGGIIGLEEKDFVKSKEVLEKVAMECNFAVTSIVENFVPTTDRKVGEFLIREITNSKYQEIKVSILGNVDAGKSTLLSCLLFGELDNSRGEARKKVFNYKHEIATGRTSSVAHHILGFDSRGNVVSNQNEFGHKLSWPEIVNQSCKIVSFFDLAGHEGYLKTTISALTTQLPNVAIILIGANMGINNPMTKEHIFLCLSLHIPFMIIITKIDICVDRKNIFDETVENTKKLLKSPIISRVTLDVKTEEDVLLAAKNIYNLSTVPIFYISNVTGEGHNLLRMFLNILPCPISIKREGGNKVEMYIDQIFYVKGTGTVIGGQLEVGKIKVGDKLIVGPNNGTYTSISVRSIHVKRVNVQSADSGRYVCLGIKKPDEIILRKGNIVLEAGDKPLSVNKFTAEIVVLNTHSTTIKVGYTPMIYVGGVRQTCKILEIKEKKCNRNLNVEIENSQSDLILRNKDRATITFQFCYMEEFVRNKARILLSEGRVKIIGKIVDIEANEVRIT